MNPSTEHAWRSPVVGLDDKSRMLTELLPDERTPKDDEARTIPDKTPAALHLASSAVDKAGLLRVPALVDLGGGHEPVTRLDGDEADDVFLPVRGAGRAVDLEAPTPRHRPPLRARDDVETEADAPRAITPHTVTIRKRVDVFEPGAHERGVSERSDSTRDARRDTPHESERERRLVESVYDTQRSFRRLEATNAARAAHISALHRALEKSGVFSERELVLAMHAREKTALVEVNGGNRLRREDRVYALGLLAREIDDRYREHTRALKEHLIEDIRDLAPAKKEAVLKDFETFARSSEADDSNFCRRELHKALRDEQVLHRAYVYALALDKKNDSQNIESRAATLLAGLDERSTT